MQGQGQLIRPGIQSKCMNIIGLAMMVSAEAVPLSGEALCLER